RPGFRPGPRTHGEDEMTLVTTPTMPARSHEDPNLPPIPWRRMIWVIWPQQRTALAGVAAVLVALTVFFWVAGLHLHHAYAAAITCHPASSFTCGHRLDAFNGMYGFLSNGLILQAVPALVGAFIGAPG